MTEQHQIDSESENERKITTGGGGRKVSREERRQEQNEEEEIVGPVHDPQDVLTPSENSAQKNFYTGVKATDKPFEISEDGTKQYIYADNGRRTTVDLTDEQYQRAHDLETSQHTPEASPHEERTKLLAASRLWVEAARPILEGFDNSTPGRPDIDEKKKRTVLALVTAEFLGSSVTDVFDRPDTVGSSTYYAKWKRDPLFVDIKERVTQIMRDFRDIEEITSVRKAVNIIRTAAPEAAQVQVDLMRNSNPFVALQASAKVLNMASEETAEKNAGVSINISASKLNELSRQAAAELEAWRSEIKEGLDE